MMTVCQVSRRTGVTVRALHHYDRLGLLPPAAVSPAGYRLYDESSLKRLQQILLFKELDFPLQTIRRILDAPGFDRALALRQQMELLTLRRDRLNGLLAHARRLLAAEEQPQKGDEPMDFSAFDDQELQRYTAQAQAAWGDTPAWQEYAARAKNRTPQQQKELGQQLLAHFAALGALRGQPPESPALQAWAAQLQAHITRDWYTCTKPILAALGAQYAAGGPMTANIDKAGGEGAAALAAAAIAVFCQA